MNNLEAQHSTHDGPAIDSREFRSALGLYASGITVIAGHDGREAIGFTCQSFHSVSMDPPLISFSVMRSSSSYPRIRETGKFSVNVLTRNQQSISNQFARKGVDKWEGIEWSMLPSQNPAIDGALLLLDCKIANEHRAGDHYIVIGQVMRIHPGNHQDKEPLLYFNGEYRHLGDVTATMK
ncbi:MAG: monooxygenase [Rhizobiaceae bacterium MnEN-MB40S]|nr:MAG: monooxygenase [Rhizobiaceae bacterium MnEN-MB40S]